VLAYIFIEEFIKELKNFIILNKYNVRRLFSVFISGESGVGKTEFAKILSDTLYPNENLIKINFGNYSTKDVLNSLIGSPRGYIGSDTGELNEKINKSKTKVILIDEFEKADSNVFNFFYELLEDGFFTDRLGEVHDLNGYIIVFTSNLSKEEYQKRIPDPLKSRFDMVYYFTLLSTREKEIFIADYTNELLAKLELSQNISESIKCELFKLSQLENIRNIKREIEAIVVSKHFDDIN
jgi:ATP-dependent Clp protease ATP-binding subunit ClpA